jgi:hypothetical protein
MALQTIKENIITTASRQENAPCLSYDYDLSYDPINGDVNIIRKIGSGGNISQPLKTSQCDYIFNNGTFTQAAIDTFGKKNIDNLYIEIQKLVDAKYKIIGGNANKAIKPGFIGSTTYDISGSPTTSSTTSSQNNLPASSTLGNTNTSSTAFNSVSSALSSLTSPLSSGAFNSLAGLNISANETTKYGSGSDKLLIYPEDLIANGQDTLHITEYKFTPPSGSALLGGNPGDILGGIARTSGASEFLGTVILPIPNNIADNNSVAWGADTMNNLTAAATAQVMGNPALAAGGAAAAGLASQIFGIPNVTPLALYAALGAKADLNDPAIKAQIEAAIGSLVLKAGQFDVPPETILARGLGVVPNSNLELLFQGPTLREFSFGWRLSPRSDKEAKTVRKIVRVFKQGMAARKINSGAAAGAPAALLGTPNVFKLEYKAGEKSISALNKFKLCALTNFSVSYAPDGQWAAYDDSQPVSLTIGMSFTEIEPIFESDYQETITGTLSSAVDLPKVTQDDVGY